MSLFFGLEVLNAQCWAATTNNSLPTAVLQFFFLGEP